MLYKTYTHNTKPTRIRYFKEKYLSRRCGYTSKRFTRTVDIWNAQTPCSIMCVVYRLRRDILPEVPTLQLVDGSQSTLGIEKKKTRFVFDNC